MKVDVTTQTGFEEAKPAHAFPIPTDRRLVLWGSADAPEACFDNPSPLPKSVGFEQWIPAGDPLFEGGD